MNGREQMKAARAKARGRERRPAKRIYGCTNRYDLEDQLIELGAHEAEAFWARYSYDPLVERVSLTRLELKLAIMDGLSRARKLRNNGPLPLP